jgi:hypothetical protein
VQKVYNRFCGETNQRGEQMSKFAENEIHAIVMQFPSGKFGYVGFKIPAELRFDETPERIEQFAICPQFLKTRAYPTEGEAIQALADWLAAHPEYVNTGG